jgi:hypothetical protein
LENLSSGAPSLRSWMRRNITYENNRIAAARITKAMAGAGIPASGTLAGSRIVMGANLGAIIR